MLRGMFVVLACVRASSACPTAIKQIAAAHGTPVIDGSVDDPVWQSACWISDFEQKTPDFGKPPTHPMKVAVAIEGGTLFVAARMWSAGPDDLDDALTARDDTDGAERFIVSLDPSHTRRLAYSFAVTAAGVRADWIHTDDNEGERDHSWDPVWVGKTKRLVDGWSVELAVPLSQLRLPRTPATGWGINFDWYLPRKNEDVFWRAVPKDVTAWASYFGELVELPTLEQKVSIELLPYISVRGTLAEDRPAPPSHRAIAGFEAGLDAKLRPLPGLVINATVNPDFAQVEADPAFVNLTAYEVELEEKRPFFVENNSLFHNYQSIFFYSRRIGGLPTRLPNADAIDLPLQSRILGAVAAGGYIEAKTQIAAIAAVTDETHANAIVDGRRTDLVVSPLTFWGATHVEHQLNATSLASFTGTLVERALGGTGLDQILNRSAFVTAADAILRSDDNTWELFPFVGLSGVFGSAASITAIEQSSAHYFQRPDGHEHVDLDAHQMIGWNAGTWLAKRAGMYQGTLNLTFEAPTWEINDVGVLPHTTGFTDLLGEISRDVTEPSKHLYAWSTLLHFEQAWQMDGTRRPLGLVWLTSATLPSFWTGTVSATVNTPGDSPSLTRGGPAMHVDHSESLALTIASPAGRTNSLSATVDLLDAPTLDRGVTASITAATRVTPALRLDLVPSLTWTENRRQYVATVTDATARYVFGHIHRHEVALELRATWSLSPDMVLTLYAQPFISSGKYAELGELTDPDTGFVRWYGSDIHFPGARRIIDGANAFSVDEPDYAIASLRSTAVLRWEFRPGSTLYVAWQQQRGGIPSPIAQPLHSTVGDAFTQSAIHTLAIKLSYWFG